MASYHSLRVFGYENSKEATDKEYGKRINNYTTIVTGLKINPMIREIRGNQIYNLFVLPIVDLLNLQDKILRNSNEITRLVNELPEAAPNQFFNRTLRDEIMSTNEIEGVKTTNKEVNNAIMEAQANSNKNTRLQSFAKMYLKIKKREILKIQKLDDIRVIYDYLLQGEVKEKDLPDGKLFRNKFARIGTDFMTVHQPKINEADFTPDLLDWIAFINNDDVPFLIKTFVAHYFFEYIHPFNDGNGRTGRYIACVYLGKKLDPYTAISFSHEINKHKTNYYKAFKAAGAAGNYGEATFFVLTMLNILERGQESIIEELQNSRDALKYVSEELNASSYSKIQCSILYILTQAWFFNDSGLGIEDRELYKYLKAFHKTQVRRELDELSKMEIIEATKKSPLVHKLTKKFFTSININLEVAD